MKENKKPISIFGPLAAKGNQPAKTIKLSFCECQIFESKAYHVENALQTMGMGELEGKKKEELKNNIQFMRAYMAECCLFDGQKATFEELKHVPGPDFLMLMGEFSAVNFT